MADDKFKAIEDHFKEKFKNKIDPWGLKPEQYLKHLKLFYPIYRHYFDVKIHGLENLDSTKNYMIISNHTGQIPIDAMLICTAFAVESNPPRILRPLIERFLTSLPFLGKFSHENGAVLGDRANCLQLLERKENLLIFPEGASGIAKTPNEYYQLRPFTKGFLRMALQANVEIVPICVVGAEEFYPFVLHLDKVARFLKIPALPLTPNILPLPSPIDIYVGSPILLKDNINADSIDEDLEPFVTDFIDRINSMITTGLEQRRTLLGRIKK